MGMLFDRKGACPGMSASPVSAAPKVGWPFIVMLGLMAAIAPLSVSIHIQSIPAIAADLRAPYASAQLTVSLFLFTFAFVQLFVGPLSDRLGRRPVLFGGLAVFAIGSLIAAFAPTIEIMIAARMLQAAGGCASLVTPRAVVRDRLSGVEAARILALVSMLQSTAPIFSPIIGGLIDIAFGWHAIFAFLAVYALGIGLVAWLGLPESRPIEAGSVASVATILSRYRALLGNRRYLAYAAVFALGTTGYFGFLASGPAVLIGDMGLKPWHFSIILGTISVQFVISGYLASRLVLRLGIDRVLLIGALLQIVAAAGFWVAVQTPTAIGVTLTMCVFTFSNGLVFANSLAGATAVDPRIAGSASSMLGALQFVVGGVVALAVASLPMINFGALPWILMALAVGTLVSVLVAMTSSGGQRQ
jgi:MFS transporter, DHA1 family, multidrug resistance protein